jgi:phage shock protein A
MTADKQPVATPRTRAAQHNMGSLAEPHYVVDVEMAEELERELAAAQAALKEANEKIASFCMDYRMKCDAETKTLHTKLSRFTEPSEGLEKRLRFLALFCSEKDTLIEAADALRGQTARIEELVCSIGRLHDIVTGELIVEDNAAEIAFVINKALTSAEVSK